jgi:hypothetical protein
LERIISTLKTLRVGKIYDEYELQGQIAEALTAAGIEYKKECKLCAGCRVDFLTSSGVAIEVKKGKPNRAQLDAQINRYANLDEVNAVVIVVETSLRTPIRSTRNGKRCAVVGLQKLWGIAL